MIERDETGRGIKVSAGDQFTIPAGWLTMSLDPSQSRAKFTQRGIAWYVTRILYDEAVATDAEALEELLTRYEEQADDVLERSEKLANLDLESEEDGPQAWEILSSDKDSVEWWASVEGTMVHHVRDALAKGDVSQASIGALHMQAARTMLIFKRSLEQHLWTGYRHYRNVYDIAAAAAPPAEADLIQALRPAFEKLPEDVLRAWVDAEVDIGPKMNVTQLDENLLRALAKHHLDQFGQRRREQETLAQQQDARTKNRLQGAGLTLTAVTIALAVLKAFGWF